MFAMVLSAIAPIDTAPLQATERPAPEPEHGEVRVRVACCAVCRTDLHVIEGDLPALRLPIVPGHQVVGSVDRLGPGCRRLAVGQRVGIAWLRGTCGACAWCHSQRENLCPTSRYTGYHADGGFAEYATVAEDYAYELPDALDDVQAAPLLCGGIIGYRALRRACVRPGSRVALWGFGSSAHIALQVLLHWGCEVYVVTRGAARIELARALGAAWAGRRAEDMPRAAQSAIIFAPAGELVPAALEHTEPGGAVALAGIHMTDVPRLSYSRHLFNERDLHSVTANTREDGRALLLEAAAIPIRPEVTTYSLGDANRALQDLKHGRLAGTGVLVVG